MDGREPVLEVREHAAPEPTPQWPDRVAADEDGPARVTVRLPEQVKRQAETLAQNADQSLNTWIVQALRRAVEGNRSDHHKSTRRITGWA